MGFIIRRFITRPKGALTSPNPGIWDQNLVPGGYPRPLWYYGLDPINFFLIKKNNQLGQRGRRWPAGMAGPSGHLAWPAGSATGVGGMAGPSGHLAWPAGSATGVGGMAGPSGHLVRPGRVGQACGAGIRGKDGRRAAAIDRPSWHEGEGWGKAHALYPSPQAKFTGIVRPGGWGCPAPPLLLVGPPGHLGSLGCIGEENSRPLELPEPHLSWPVGRAFRTPGGASR